MTKMDHVSCQTDALIAKLNDNFSDASLCKPLDGIVCTPPLSIAAPVASIQQIASSAETGSELIETVVGSIPEMGVWKIRPQNFLRDDEVDFPRSCGRPLNQTKPSM